MQISAYASIGIIGITVLVFGIIFATNIESDIVEDVFDKKMEVEDAFNKEIQTSENPIVQEEYDKIQNVNNTKYKMRDREWQTSGPFQIDRSEYAIGEKIFIRMGGLQMGEKGDIAVMRPLNDTHTKFYLSIPFDETKNPTFNQYFEPAISKNKGICSVDDLDGTWFLVFRGTEYAPLEFKVDKELGVVGGTSIEPAC